VVRERVQDVTAHGYRDSPHLLARGHHVHLLHKPRSSIDSIYSQKKLRRAMFPKVAAYFILQNRGLTLVPCPRGESMGILRGLEESDLGGLCGSLNCVQSCHHGKRVQKLAYGSIRRAYGGLTLVPFPRGESMGILRGLEETDLVSWGLDSCVAAPNDDVVKTVGRR